MMVYKAHCLAQDTVDIFTMMTDCAFEPKSIIAADVGMHKNKETHKFLENFKTGEIFNNNLF